MLFDAFTFAIPENVVSNFVINLLPSISVEVATLISLAAFFILGVWLVVWKGLALWVAAKNNQPIWFVALLIINTLGLFEIAYLLYHYNKGTLHVRKQHN